MEIFKLFVEMVLAACMAGLLIKIDFLKTVILEQDKFLRNKDIVKTPINKKNN